MKTYNQTSIPSSSEELARVIQEIHDSQSLWDVSKLAARGVYSGRLGFHDTWQALWVAAVVAGVNHLEAQEVVGRTFAWAKFELVMS